jgi:hypothetical protein
MSQAQSEDTDTEWHVRVATGRDDSASVRVSLPADATEKLGIESGDNIVVVIDDDGVRIEEVPEFFG